MGDTRDACAIYEHSDFSTFFSSRHYHLLGGDFYSAHQQRFEPNHLHFDHQTFQGNDPSALVQLQTKKVCGQKGDSKGIRSLVHLGGNVARARDAR